MIKKALYVFISMLFLICIIISGGVYEATIAGYTDEEAESIIAEKIQKLFYFDFQENNSWIYPPWR